MMSPTESSARSRREAIKVSALAATAGLVMVHRDAGARTTEAQENPGAEIKPRPEDVGSMEAVVKALYDTISGPAGPRDWDRLRSLFLPGARLIPSGRRRDGSTASPRPLGRGLHQSGGAPDQGGRLLRERDPSPRRAVRRRRARLQHLRVAARQRTKSPSCGGSTASSSSSTASGGGSSPSSGTPSVPISRSPPSTCREEVRPVAAPRRPRQASCSIAQPLTCRRNDTRPVAPIRRRRCCRPCRSRRRAGG